MINKKIVKKLAFFWLKILFFILIFLFLLTNIFFSQNLSPLFIGLFNNHKQSIIEYLKKIKPLPFFKTELNKFTNIFGKEIADQVFKEEKEIDNKIALLEKTLEKNPKARDVLYALYQLYSKKGDQKKADQYLKRAKEIDPEIN